MYGVGVSGLVATPHMGYGSTMTAVVRWCRDDFLLKGRRCCECVAASLRTSGWNAVYLRSRC